MQRIGTIGIAALAALCIAGCESRSTEGSRAQELKDPYPYTVERRDIVGYTMLQNGAVYIPPEAQAIVYPKYKAPVEQVLATVGQRVNRGEVLIELNFPSAEAALEQAQATVRDAEAALEQARSSVNEPVRQAQQALDEARRIERQIRANTDPNGDATALVQARQQREAAEMAVQEAKRATASALRPYQEQLEQAREAMQQAREGARLAALRAPISGVVTMLNAQPGQVVGDDANEPLAKIVDLGAIKVKARIYADRASLVREGKDVAIVFKELPNKVFDGRVTRVDPVPSQGSEVNLREVTIDFDNDRGQIKDGFAVEWVGIKVGEAKGVLAVPNDAIALDASGKPVVQVMENGQWRPRVVEIGLSDGKFTEVKEGLREGETVQVRPGSSKQKRD